MISASKPGPSSVRILIVDDEPTVLMSMRETLRHEGYTVLAAPGPEEALALAQQQHFTVVLSDQQMPGMSGVELLAKVKQLHPQTVRILVSALPTAELAIEAINQAEIFRFIVKPWQRRELIETVTEAVARFEKASRDQLRLATVTAMNETLTRLTQSLQSQLDERRGRKS